MFYQLIYIWNPTYLEKFLNKTSDFSLFINGVSMIVFSICIILGGYLSDLVGRKKVIIFSSAFIILFFGPLFYLIKSGNADLYIYIYMALLSVSFGFYVGASSTLFAEIFDIKIRSTALSLSYNIPYAVAGGLTPAMLSYILFNYNYFLIVLVTVMIMFIACITAIKIKETYKKN